MGVYRKSPEDGIVINLNVLFIPSSLKELPNYLNEQAKFLGNNITKEEYLSVLKGYYARILKKDTGDEKPFTKDYFEPIKLQKSQLLFNKDQKPLEAIFDKLKSEYREALEYEKIQGTSDTGTRDKILVKTTSPSSSPDIQRGTAEEAIALVNKAIDYLRANGASNAFNEFPKKDGPFTNRDLFISAYDLNGKCLANAKSPGLVGKDFISLRDSDGKYLIKQMIDIANSHGKGWVDYRWVEPTVQRIDNKSYYLQKVDGENIFIGCSINK